MGQLKQFPVDELIQTHELNRFVETGTSTGDGLHFASLHAFEKLASIEIDGERAQLARQRFTERDDIEIIHADSCTGLRQILGEFLGQERVLFWLDAHYPGARYSSKTGWRSFNVPQPEQVRTPLETELRLILEARGDNIRRDVLLIDDLRIYEDGPFQAGNMPPEIAPPQSRNIQFVEDLFSRTHNIQKDYRDEGYLILTPR